MSSEPFSVPLPLCRYADNRPTPFVRPQLIAPHLAGLVQADGVVAIWLQAITHSLATRHGLFHRMPFERSRRYFFLPILES